MRHDETAQLDQQRLAKKPGRFPSRLLHIPARRSYIAGSTSSEKAARLLQSTVTEHARRVYDLARLIVAMAP